MPTTAPRESCHGPWHAAGAMANTQQLLPLLRIETGVGERQLLVPDPAAAEHLMHQQSYACGSRPSLDLAGD
jgi:hypothetical protein